ncbi:hypothetical protein BDP27DRAFT_1428624 [Rhodocollybia butyracea]|uniref:Uncharacterized protein n=1 Tax=Rhodocollybia butyracea TaxID=206335 RepID=A0A9P5U0U4_9AGAR|nr:hypothetical protein BDP27DRAFT_1428624 [Rhodocollybia butyracea]
MKYYEIEATRTDDANQSIWFIPEPPTESLRTSGAITHFWLNADTDDIYYLHEASECIKAKKEWADIQIAKSKAYKHRNPRGKSKRPRIDPIPESILTSFPVASTSLVIDDSAVEPWMLWLPPDRLGYNLYDTQLNYQVACKALEMGGVNGVEFYKHLKKDKKEHGDDWIYKQDCAASTISITDPSTDQKCSVLQGLCTPTFKGRFGNWEIELRNTYFLAIEWLFEPDPEHHREEMRKNKRARNTENRRRRRARKAEEKKPLNS